MKKYLALALLATFYFENSRSQAGEWTWISGSNVVNAPGVYGTQGIPSVNNHPPANYGHQEWKDQQGNFWIYCGWTPGNNDLWKFDPTTLEWTWVKGSGGFGGQQPVYGIKGVPSLTNSPGSRISGVPAWVDTSGHLWMFGGSYRNDLWRYNIGTNEWTWMSGDTINNQPGIHGTLGVPSLLNIPGGRVETTSAWADSLNNLWMFGGLGFDGAGTNGNLNDLMKYNISTGEWTWMSGSSLVNAPSSYGTKGVSSPANVPGARFSYNKWKDRQGNLWMMGGMSGLGGFPLNDVWKFDPSINEWTWMSGPSVLNDPGVYQSNCVFDSLNMPRSRFEQRSGVTDNCGRFWLFGGATYNAGDFLNDLWVFDPVEIKWNWVSGTNVFNQVGNYGTLGVSSPLNMPSSRIGASAWWGDDDRFYMFAGSSSPWSSWLADVWVFTPDTACSGICLAQPPQALFTAPHHICPGTCTDFTNLSQNATSYQWYFPGGSPSTSTDIHPQSVCYNTPGTYDVSLVAFNAAGSDSISLPNYMTVFPYSPSQSIIQNGDTLISNTGFSSYQWFFDGDTISGATDYYFVATQNGNYSVICLDGNGCSVEAVILNVIAGLTETDVSNTGQLVVYPNPVKETLIIVSPDLCNATRLSMYNILGENIHEVVDNNSFKDNFTEVNCAAFKSGVYWIEMNCGNRILRTKFIKD